MVVRYGLSTQGWGGWAVDLLKSLRGRRRSSAAVALLGFYTDHPARAALVVGASARPARPALVVLLSFVLPVLVEPVFNKFTPMAHGPLRTELIALAERDGVPGARRAGRRRLAAHPGGERLRLRARARPGGSSSTTRCCARRRPPRWPPWSPTSSATPRTTTCCTGTLIGALGAAAAVIALYLLGSLDRPAARRPASPRSPSRARIALLLAVVTLAGLVAGAGAGAGVPAHRGPRRRARAGADRRPGAPSRRCSGRLAAVNLADPDPPTGGSTPSSASHPSTVERMAAARAYARGRTR